MLKREEQVVVQLHGTRHGHGEEADPKNMEHLADRLKVWADRYPFPGRSKEEESKDPTTQGHCNSNYTPEECFPNSMI